MSIIVNISFSKIFSSFSENRRKNYDLFQKSINSLNSTYSDYSFENYINNQDIAFTEDEIHAALKRLNNNADHLLTGINLDDFSRNKSIYSSYSNDNCNSFIISLFESIFGFLLPHDHYLDHCWYYKFEQDKSIIIMSESLLAELYYRKIKRIFSNILNKFFEFRKIITAQFHIKIQTYKYFDLVFSLKKEIVLKSKLVITFLNQFFYLGQYEKEYIRNLQTACRT
ncbi:MAG: hypothetical protein AB7S69_12095 [Salinivirgaceae bacterium]